MDIRQLKEYLKCAIDLESAKLTCNQAYNRACAGAQSIRAKQSYIPKPVYPEKPYLATTALPKPKASLGAIFINNLWKILLISIILIVLLDYSAALFPEKTYIKVMDFVESVGKEIVYLGVIFLAFIVVAIPFTIKAIRKESMRFEKQNLQYQEDKNAAETKYENELAEWDRTKTRIDEKHRQYCLSLNQQYEELMKVSKQIYAKLAELNRRLEDHYKNGILYEDFRNFVAVTQIYGYLASGIATELEGPNGAYAQYMNDVRTSRICDNLEEIRADMNAGFANVAQGQSMLYDELNRGNSVIAGLSNTVLQMEQNTIKNMNALQGEVSKISASSSATALNTAMISLNQYIDMKSRGVDAYYSTYSG